MPKLANKPIKLVGNKDASELLENREPIIGNGVKRLVLIGKSGKGKTRFLLKWLTMIHKPLDGVFIIAHVKEKQDTYVSINHFCEKEKIPYKMIFKGTDENQNHAKQQQLFQFLKSQQTRESYAPCCVIFDDINEKLVDELTLKMIEWCFSKSRLSFVYPVCISQDIKTSPRAAQMNTSFFCIFPFAKGHVKRAMLVGLTDYIDYERLKVLYRYIIQHKYTCIFINTDNPDESVVMMPDDRYFNVYNIKNKETDVRSDKAEPALSDDSDLEKPIEGSNKPKKKRSKRDISYGVRSMKIKPYAMKASHLPTIKRK
jgi:ABC-type oligopeptide transport system ATPase subunit